MWTDSTRDLPGPNVRVRIWLPIHRAGLNVSAYEHEFHGQVYYQTKDTQPFWLCEDDAIGKQPIEGTYWQFIEPLL